MCDRRQVCFEEMLAEEFLLNSFYTILLHWSVHADLSVFNIHSLSIDLDCSAGALRFVPTIRR